MMCTAWEAGARPMPPVHHPPAGSPLLALPAPGRPLIRRPGLAPGASVTAKLPAGGTSPAAGGGGEESQDHFYPWVLSLSSSSPLAHGMTTLLPP
jgi:hypothetical protein